MGKTILRFFLLSIRETEAKDHPLGPAFGQHFRLLDYKDPPESLVFDPFMKGIQQYPTSFETAPNQSFRPILSSSQPS